MATDPAHAAAGERLGEAVYVARQVITGAPVSQPGTGLWLRDDRIVATGDAGDLVARADPSARIVRLPDATIVPGLVDAHCHLSWLAYLLTGADCGPAAAPDIAAIQHALAGAEPGPDGWLTGSGYAEYLLADRRSPTRDDLDAAVPNTPCVLYHLSLHVCVVNSAGLRALGLDDRSPDPPRGQLGHDANGRLDGRLMESAMFDLMSANMRRAFDGLDGAGRAATIRRAGEHLAGLGLTSCTDAATDAGAFLALRETERRGELPIRVTAMFTYPEAGWLLRAGMTTGFGSDRLRIGPIKLFADGGMSSRTAALDEPYLEPPGERGFLWYETDGLADIVRECDAAGFAVGIHAQGERAIRMALDAFGRVSAPGNPARHRIEHGGAFRAELRAVAGRLGIHVVSQPGFFSALGDGYVEALGLERSAGLYPYASMAREDILVAGSSDAPVISASPLMGMRDAILRRTAAGVTLGPSERLSATEALELYTTRAAYVGGLEAELGTLEPGKLADFTVLDRDPLAVSPEALGDSIVELTVVGGRPVAGRSR